MPLNTTLLDTLPQAQRLALAYAPGAGRQRLLGFFALDARLAGIVRNSREPMLAQLRLAWWREQLSGDLAGPSRGEPLLELLECWKGEGEVLAELVNGWEDLTGAVPLPAAAFNGLAEGRAKALALIGGREAYCETAVRMGRNWAIADLATRISDPLERETVGNLASQQDWAQSPLPRPLRPIAMLHGLAVRNLGAGRPVNALDAGCALTMIRIGLLGR